MTLNGVMAVTLRYFTEFGQPAFQHNRANLWQNLCTSLLYFVVCVRCRQKESSRFSSPDEFLVMAGSNNANQPLEMRFVSWLSLTKTSATHR